MLYLTFKMAKILVYYVGDQQPQGIYEVDEKQIDGLLARGDFQLLKPELKKKKMEKMEEMEEIGSE